jgi:hypothetical protein
MFTKITPQRVSHSSGFIVQVFDRYHVEYIQGEKTALVEVDFAPIIGIYKSTLSAWEDGGILSETEKSIIIDRISEALKFMGSKVETC